MGDRGKAACGAVRFTSRVYRVNPPPDADGDILLPGAIDDGVQVIVSLDNHDIVRNPVLLPAGLARLRHAGGAVIAEGETSATPRGRDLEAKLRAAGGRLEWSIGYRVTATRPLTESDRNTWPDVRRIITRMDVFEISPVPAGACGPTCRTLGTKALKCACASSACSVRPSLPWVEQLALDRGIRECEDRDAAIKANRPPQIEREIPAYLVPGHDMLVNAAQAAVKDLDIPWHRIRYFAEPTSHNGLFSGLLPDAVWLRWDRSMWDQLETLGHELHHAAQYHHDGPRRDEAGARRYGAKLRNSDPTAWRHGVVRPLIYNDHGERL